MTKTNELQAKLTEIYNYIEEVIADRLCPPTVREIQEKFDIKSTSSVAYYLNKMEEMGLLKKSRQKSRSIEIVNSKQVKYKDMVSVPLVGSIPAGIPKLAIEEYNLTYPIPKSLFDYDNGQLFMLRVEGSSMIEIGMNDGDIIIIKLQDTAENGQIVAALVDNDCATVKRLVKDANGVHLHPENSAMADIYPNSLSILGVVVGLIRTNIQ